MAGAKLSYSPNSEGRLCLLHLNLTLFFQTFSLYAGLFVNIFLFLTLYHSAFNAVL